MSKKGRLGVQDLEALVARRAARFRLVSFAFIGVALILVVVNAATQPAVAVEASLATRWWSLIPILALMSLTGVLAARDLWLLPRRLAVHKWLVASRPLHDPLRGARRAEERVLANFESHPNREELVRLVMSGQERLAEVVAAPVVGDESEDLRRRAARVDGYRVALSTLEIDTLLKRDWVGSRAFRSALERAAELLEPARDDSLSPDAGEAEAVPRFESIAILPFSDLSPLGDQEHFSYGLAEELIDGLTRLRGLRVIARGLAFSFAGQDLSAREIGRRLAVETVLEGNVQKDGDRVRVNARLVSVADGQEIWSADLDEAIEEVFKIEDQLASGVLGALDVIPSASERRAFEKPATRVAGAYEYYLRGLRYFAQYHGRGIQFALEMFTRASELDPDYALAHAGIADCCAFLYANAGRSPEYRDQALQASARALELDPELAEAHVARGVALSQGDRADEAGQFFETAIRLNPQLYEAHYFYARHHFTCGEPEKAIQYYESASELRPEDYQVPILSVQIYDDLGRVEEGNAKRRLGIQLAEEHLKLHPDDARALYMGANVLVSVDRVEEGLEWAHLARELQPNEPMTLYNLSCVYSLAGETDKAIDCLATSIERGFSYRDWAEHDSNLDFIRSDPRFTDLMTRL